ncbi:MAG: SIS domain-containing protein [Thaumarchaeota archaeon]|nr:SIS domain-containing protein [Nitrososphaerota archaeon]
MYAVYDKWPEIAENAFQSELEEISFSDINHIVFAGMGGSGTIGSIFSSILSKSNIHVSVVKGYSLPKTVDKETLVITTSISGNTTETLTVLDSAKKIDCKIIAFSSGGKMERFCHENSIQYFKISQIHSPRTSLTQFLYTMLKILSDIIPLKNDGIMESIMKLNEIKKTISSENLTESNSALQLALWIRDFPFIYYPWGLKAAAIRFKNSLQENSKIHVITEDVIESCHNGIVSWETSSKIQPILIRGQEDNEKTKERWDIIHQYFSENKIDCKEIISVEGNILTKIICLIYLLDYTSIFLAVKKEIDPSPVKSIDFIKKRL